MKLLCFFAVALQSIGLLAADFIPGVQPVDLYLNLQKSGFEVKKNFSRGANEFLCIKGLPETVLTGTAMSRKATEEVYLVEASFSNYPHHLAVASGASHLAFVATLPYEGSRPESASKWVVDNIEAGGTCVIGPVVFQIEVTPTRRVLRLTPYQPPSVSATQMQPEKAVREIPLPEGWRKPGEAASTAAEVEPANTKEPAVGMTKEEAVKLYGKPTMELNEWTHWPTFKIAFEEGAAVKVEAKKKP